MFDCVTVLRSGACLAIIGRAKFRLAFVFLLKRIRTATTDCFRGLSPRTIFRQ